MKIKKFILIAFSTVIAVSILTVSVLGFVYIYAKKNIDFDFDESLFNANKSGTLTRLYYNVGDGNTYVPKRFSEVAPLAEKKVWCSYQEISENLKNAFIASEDRDFWMHKGVNYKRTAFALLNEIFHFKSKFGASTITQQVVKNISGDDEQTVKRKFSEIIRAGHIETKHTKEEIFELYLNIVPMGSGIEGVGLASEYYFGKTPMELNLSECAILAGITNAPSKYNPYKHPEECLKKRNNVLFAMKECGSITPEEYNSALNMGLSLKEQSDLSGGIDSWFAETVCNDVCEMLIKEKHISNAAAKIMVYNGGLSIYTTVNPKIQTILENYFYDYDELPSECQNGLDIAMIVTDSKNGDVVGVVGNAGKKEKNKVLNHALIPHLPASALKPIALYAPLLEEKRINFATVFEDLPLNISVDKEGKYTLYPKNSPDVYSGLITVKDAVRYSKNTVAVNLYNLLGASKIYSNLTENFGFNTIVYSEKNEKGKTLSDLGTSSLALGQLTYGVPLRKLTSAYTVFSAGGVLNNNRTFTEVYDSKGELLLKNEKTSKRIFSSETAAIMNQLLINVTDSGTAKKIKLGEIVDTAGKTGTSGGNKDKLFVGYTPYYTAGIWCGYSKDGKSVNISTSHLELWDKIMHEIHYEKINNAEEPECFSVEGLEYLPYCKDSGELYSEKCMFDLRGSRIEYGYFTSDNRPEKECHVHVLCNKSDVLNNELLEIIPEGQEWVSLINVDRKSMPPEIRVTDGIYIYLPPEEDDEYCEV